MCRCQDIKSLLLYALNLEVATHASHKDRPFIRGATVTADEPCEYWIAETQMGTLKEEIQTIKALEFQTKRNANSSAGVAGGDGITCEETCLRARILKRTPPSSSGTGKTNI
ncbi:hypothetical protein TNCV_2107131 [Trichonephila clavipes]|nr:hypothetical protein TNCV_2107131 [Trichonephila clavipes]